MSAAGDCPKCGGQMQRGSVYGDLRIKKQGDVVGDRMDVLYCRICGFIELYKEASTKEPWRWRKEEEKPLTLQPAKPEAAKQEEATQRGRKRLVR